MEHEKWAPPPLSGGVSSSDAVSGLTALRGREEDGRAECERALNALREGRYDAAVRLIKEASQRFEGSGLVHRVEATVCAKAASAIDDPNARRARMRDAVESARRAAELSPDSIEFALFYANLMWESEGSEQCEEVMRECERALTIEDPVDPGEESLDEESEQMISTAEGRISHVKTELRSLVHRAHIASLSTWLKSLNHPTLQLIKRK
uniref:DUF627 domain-containing protein n=1 Tax=Kalanchoe fedtschenkoi TaxID=63787 RepID=A0A7N0VLQ0_KALFE